MSGVEDGLEAFVEATLVQGCWGGSWWISEAKWRSDLLWGSNWYWTRWWKVGGFGGVLQR